ncbi:Pre-mRNA-splicing factor prp1 like protein [Verticillium longisporum]|nr:Pre-mRNA-splicing factor prp1 like protein [Verticillium longisporum]
MASFTTRSDLGPAREGPSEDQIKEAVAKRAAQLGIGADGKKGDDKDDDKGGDDDRFKDPDNEEVDEKMGKRRQKQREARELAEKEEYERNNPKISQQFADLKRALGTVTDEEWASLPERQYAVPDSVLAAARDASELGTTVSDEGVAPSPDGADGTMTNFAKIGAARDKVLKSRLEQASLGGTDTTAGSATSIDPKGYITSLDKSMMNGTQAQVADINRWIAGARLEELAGKTVAARNVIARGCEKCPKNVDVWLENIRLNDVRNAKIIAAEAIKKNDKSVLLWVEAMRLENEPRAKKRVIRLALDHIPDSEALWKEAVNLEDDQTDARLLLAKATEIIPLSVDLWLALARLETPENAQKVLNKARKAEQLGASVNVMKRAVNVLVKESAMPKREEWIAEAEKCEEEGAVATCGDIIKETLGWGLDEDDDRKDTWMDDARGSINRGMTLWMAAADLERNHGNKESLCQVLEKAVDACPKSEVLWMMLAKEKWQAGEVDNARRVLARAFNQNPDNEDIWLAAVKLEAENDQPERARKLLEDARDKAPTDRVWMKSVVFERVLGNTDAALDLVQQALQYFPAAAKLWMLKGQIYEDLDKLGQAREAYSTGVKAVPASVPLWLLYSRLEERAGLVVKARSVLDRARLAVPKSPALWCESVRVERRAGNVNQAKSLMAKALQEVPKSGLLWSEQIWHLEARTQRKPRSLEAIKKVDNDPILFVAVARLFWGERKLEKAQNWFEKALVLDSNNGDTWAWYYKFLLQHGTEEKRGEVITKCVLVEPRQGEYWQAIAKRPANARKGTEEILNLVANSLER